MFSISSDNLRELRAEDWNLVASQGELSSVVNASLPLDATGLAMLRESAERVFEATPNCAACLFLDGDDPLINAWNTLPPVVASIVSSPTSHVRLIAFNDAATNDARFSRVSDPLWCWLHQTVKSGRHVGIVPIDVVEPDLARVEYPSLAPRTAPELDVWVRQELDAFDVRTICGKVHSEDDAVAVRAGLFQMHDLLDESHELSQSVEGRGRHRGGDYWHAINHRREPDDANSKYWFRQVGSHPIFAELALRAHDVLKREAATESDKWIKRLGVPDNWDPFAFVDLCSECRRASSNLEHAARRIQFEEMLLLMDQTLRDAVA